MKRQNWCFLLLLVCSLSSCLLTVYPIYTPNDIVYDKTLVGYYEKEDKKGMLIEPLGTSQGSIPSGVPAIKEKGYRIRLSSPDGNVYAEYVAFMVILNRNRYLDFFPVPGREQLADPLFKSLMIPMHAAYRVDYGSADTVELRQFNQGFLQDLIDKRKIRIKHEKTGDRYFITAGTAELQQYIRKYGHQKEAYEEESNTYFKIKRS